VSPSDVDLVRAAQAGDATSLGLLLDRHRTGLHAMALGMLGHGPEAEDAVHDTFVVALRSIGGLREPSAVGAWLRSILRNACLMRLRDSHERPFERIEELAGPSPDALPEQAIDQLAMRDWAWNALERLSEPLRLTVMLRYFSRASSYEQIAAICGVPVGTVRSRLSQAKTKLSEALLETASRAHGDAGSLADSRRRHFSAVFDDYNRGSSDVYVASCTIDVEMRFGAGAVRGPQGLSRGIAEDLDAGVRQHLVEVVASPEITIVETRFENPPEKPFHCPPATTQVYFHRGEAIRAGRIYHAPRPPTGG
jgi:RNA polymerase sigma-70 factor (ECF subfamily)